MTDIPVWTWLGESAKLWRLIFDDSRKEKNSLVQQWLENNKYEKCAFLGRCLSYPHVQLEIETKIAVARKEFNSFSGRADEKRRLKAAYQKISAEGAKQMEYLQTQCGNDERDSEARGLGICKKQYVKLHMKKVKGEVHILDGEMDSGDFDDLLVIWCEPTLQGLKEAVVYAAHKEKKLSRTKRNIQEDVFKALTDLVLLRVKVKEKFEEMTKDDQAKKLWTSAKADEVVASGLADILEELIKQDEDSEGLEDEATGPRQNLS